VASQLPFSGYRLVGYVEMAAHFAVANQFKYLKKQKVVFRVYGCGSLANKVMVTVS